MSESDLPNDRLARMVQAAANQMEPQSIQKLKETNTSNPYSESNAVVLLSSEFNEPKCDRSDFAELNIMFAGLFGAAYYNKDSPEFARLQLLWAIIEERGYSKEDLRSMMLKFAAGRMYPTWKPNEFLDSWEPPKLLTYNQYLALSPSDRKWFVDYSTSRGPMWGDSRIIGDKLKRVMSRNAGATRGDDIPLSSARNDEREQTHRMRAEVRWFREYMRRESDREKESAALATARADRDIAQRERDALSKILRAIDFTIAHRYTAQYMKYVDGLLDSANDPVSLWIELINSLPSEQIEDESTKGGAAQSPSSNDG
jgi:hypothetical protein